MVCRATLVTVPDAELGGSRVDVLRSHAPLALRPTGPKGPEPLVRRRRDVARVAVASGAAGPLGGDDWRLDVRVRAGSTLVLSEVSATLVLPGARGGRSRMRINVTVEDGATLVWMAEPVIAASGCDHVYDIDIALGRYARFLMRDELVLGRHDEPPGRLEQRVRIRRDGRSLYHQRLELGTGARGWDSPAVLGGRKCVGTALVVDPEWADGAPDTQLLGREAALMPMAGPGVIVNALADNAVAMRRLLDEGIVRLGDPWTPRTADQPQLKENCHE